MPFQKSTAPKPNFRNQEVNTGKVKSVSAIEGKRETAASAGCNWRTKRYNWYKNSKYNSGSYTRRTINDGPQRALKNKGIIDSGCSRHMTGNKAYLAEYEDYNGGPVAFGGSKGHITGKGKIKTGKLDFEDVCYVKELQQFNLFSVSQICDKKNKVHFTDTECLVLSPEFKLPDENQVLLRVPRQYNMYSINLDNIVPSEGLTCLLAKASIDESNKWHRRLGHVNFKTLNKLVKGNLVRGLLSKTFQNDQTCVACQKRKQHKASCKAKGNQKGEYSCIARTPQQNGVAERKNRTLIEAARTMLADSLLPNSFWAEAVNTTCYVLNRVLVTKPQYKTPYELITSKQPIISYIRPFGCYVTILNTIDHLGKFEEKADEGFLVGYSLSSKAFRVYNLETKRVEENLHIKFQENKPNVAGKGPSWLFDIEYLTDSMNYQPVSVENRTNHSTGPKEVNHGAGTEVKSDAGSLNEEEEDSQEYYVLPMRTSYSSKNSELKLGAEKIIEDDGLKSNEMPEEKEDQPFIEELERLQTQEKEANDTAEAFKQALAQSDEDLLIQRVAVRTNSTNTVSTVTPLVSFGGAFADKGLILKFRNICGCQSIPHQSYITFIKKHKSWRSILKSSNKRQVKQGSKGENAPCIEDESWVDAMQEELLQFKIQDVWILVDLPYGKKAIGTKWVYRNKRDERGIVVRNKARMSRCIFVYGIHEEEVYVSQPPGFVDPKFPNKVYKVVKALYSLHQAPRAWYATLSNFLLKNGYRRGAIDKTLFIKKNKKDIMLMSSMGELTFFLGLQVKQKEEGIFISQDKYVAEILKKFDFECVKTANTPIETQKPLIKDEEAANVDVHFYRSMIGSLMYLTASRPDIMFAVCACSRFQVTPKTSHLHAVKRIFRYLKGKPKLGLWYPRESSFELEAFTDSDYAGANLDRKSTTEYVAAAHCCGQVLWVQNQMLDYGFNFMNTKIYIDNESTLCIVKNPVFHSKTKHIEIRHHFIRDAYEKKLIQVLKIHTDLNVADLLTKAFDGPRKPKESSGYAEIVDFLQGTHIKYALTHNPTVYDSLVKQFWQTATALTIADGTLELKATIDTHEYTITEASIRSKLQLDDALGLSIPKSGGWDQFGSNLANALICLSTNRIYNFSKLIFDGMVANLKSKSKFLMYPRFLQIILDVKTDNKQLFLPMVLTEKIFGNMKRGFRGAHRPLLPSMLHVVANLIGPSDQARIETLPSSSTIPPPPISNQPPPTPPPIPSSPTPITEPPPTVQSPPPAIIAKHTSVPETTPTPVFEPSPSPTHESMEHIFEEPSTQHQPLSPREHEIPTTQATTLTVEDLLHLVPTLMTKIDSLEPELKQTKETMGKAIVKLVKKVKKLEIKLKKRSVVLTTSDNEEPKDQGRKFQRKHKDPQDSFVTPTKSIGKAQDEEISPNTLEAAKTLSKVASQGTKSIDKGKRFKRRKDLKKKDFDEVNAGDQVNTGIEVSTGREPVNAAKGQREGKAPMTADEETQTLQKTKEQVLQEEASLDEAIRLDTLEREEISKQVHLDALLAKRMAEEQDQAEAKLEANTKLKESVFGKDLSEEDFAKKMLKKLTFEEVKAEFDKLVKQLDTFVPMSFEATKESLKMFGVELEARTAKKPKISDKDVQDSKEKIAEAKKDESTKKRRTQMARKGFHIDKDETEKCEDSDEEDFLDTNVLNPVPVAIKPPSIVTYKIIKQGKKGVYQVVRADGTDKVYISFGAMLKDITRDDITELFRIVMNRFGMNEPKDEHEKVLWEYLKNMFDAPLSTDKIWSLPGQQRVIN
ncbi:putative ribonuclease H-like domain-containing protein [Tanacetum coccineum]